MAYFGASGHLVTRCRVLVVSGLRVFVICFGGCFPHRLAFYREAVSIVNDAVEDGIRKGQFTDDVVPGLDG